jgi:starch-binding outer membrane protein, SusD/RagB family
MKIIMNKFKLNILVLGALSISIFSSCSDNFLDVESKTAILDQNFYKTEADAEMALIGCYDGYQRTTSSGGIPFYLASEMMSDECFAGFGNSDARNNQVIDRFDKTQSPSDNNLFKETWANYYAGIYRCNMLLQKLPEITTWTSKTDSTIAIKRNRIEGEARFLRALMYFDLVRLFENVPLLTVPTKDIVPQASPAETYKLIASDLKFAAANIPANAYPKANAAVNDGRVSRYAAEALLARVYLFYTGYYAKDDLGVTKTEVLAGLEDVIKSKEFDLLPNFKSLWPAASYIPVLKDTTLDKSGYAGKGNKEVVFAQKFNNTSNWNGMVDGNAWLVSMGLRKINFSPYGTGWGGCTVNPNFASSFTASDKRKSASIIDIVGEGIDKTFDKKEQREYTGYTVKKYSPTALPDGTPDIGGEKNFMISQDQDYIVIRYADVLLMAAELGSPSALNYYNMVHTRAGLTAAASVTPSDIQEERRLELAFEGIRYWDLLRTGLNNAATAIATSQKLLSGGVDDQVTIQASKVIETRGFSQIPNNQITISNGVLKQNDGWK